MVTSKQKLAESRRRFQQEGCFANLHSKSHSRFRIVAVVDVVGMSSNDCNAEDPAQPAHLTNVSAGHRQVGPIEAPDLVLPSSSASTVAAASRSPFGRAVNRQAGQREETRVTSAEKAPKGHAAACHPNFLWSTMLSLARMLV